MQIPCQASDKSGKHVPVGRPLACLEPSRASHFPADLTSFVQHNTTKFFTEVSSLVESWRSSGLQLILHDLGATSEGQAIRESLAARATALLHRRA